GCRLALLGPAVHGSAPAERVAMALSSGRVFDTDRCPAGCLRLRVPAHGVAEMQVWPPRNAPTNAFPGQGSPSIRGIQLAKPRHSAVPQRRPVEVSQEGESRQHFERRPPSADDPFETFAVQEFCSANWTITPFRLSQFPVLMARVERQDFRVPGA